MIIIFTGPPVSQAAPTNFSAGMQNQHIMPGGNNAGSNLGSSMTYANPMHQKVSAV